MTAQTIVESPAAQQCVNCGAVRSGPYCSSCGQPEFEGRHTLRSVLRGFVGRVINIDKGFLHTVVQLTIRPGTVIHGYWSGQTMRFTNPAGYLLLATAALALSVRLFADPTGAADEDRLFTLLLVPLVAGASRLLFLRGARNYAEHLIAVMYLCGHVLLCLAVLFAGYRAQVGSISIYGAVVAGLSLAYFLWGYSRAFPTRPLLALFAGVCALVLGAATWLAMIRVMVILTR